MALASTTVWECNAAATSGNVNGGGFNPANANMLTDLTTDANTANTDDPIVSSASYNFVAGDVGHWVYIQSGTNWTPGWYKISAVASNKATLMAAVGEAVQRSETVGYPSPMYTANTVAGCATVGTPTNGTFTIDYSQGTAGILTLTDFASTNGSGVLTTATGGFTPVMVGNIFNLNSGTNALAGWYELTQYTDGNTFTIDRDCAGAGDLSSGRGNVGGAIPLNTSLDDDFFDAIGGGGVRVFYKFGTFTLGESVSASTGGTAGVPMVHEGYQTIRGDTPQGANRPIISCAAFTFNVGAGGNVDQYNLIATGTASNLLFASSEDKIINCKTINTSTTANRAGILMSTDCFVYKCEAVSIRGYAFQASAGVPMSIIACYLHDSLIGMFFASNVAGQICNNIVASCVTSAIELSPGQSTVILNNTLYGAENKLGLAIDINALAVDIRILNNIIYGFVTGVAQGTTTQKTNYLDYNDFYNNTTDVADVAKGETDVAVDPAFTDVTQITGTAATSSTNVLTVGSGTPFGSVVDNVDFVYLVSGSGTGFTAGIYAITSHTTTTLTVNANITSSGAGSSIVWQVTLGHNFLPTGAI